MERPTYAEVLEGLDETEESSSSGYSLDMECDELSCNEMASDESQIDETVPGGSQIDEAMPGDLIDFNPPTFVDQSLERLRYEQEEEMYVDNDTNVMEEWLDDLQEDQEAYQSSVYNQDLVPTYLPVWLPQSKLEKL